VEVLEYHLNRVDRWQVKTMQPTRGAARENRRRHPAGDCDQLLHWANFEFCPPVKAALDTEPAGAGQLLFAQAGESGLFDGENPRSQFERDGRLSTHGPKGLPSSGCDATSPVKTAARFRAKTVEFSVSKEA